jgi:ubiquinol-cytochrome c reductase cytochrome b subunit
MLHFLVPFIILTIVLAHLIFLHDRGSTSSLLCHGDYDKIKFFPFYAAKDRLNLLFWLGFFFLALSFPFFLGDAEIFIAANSLSSPVHIVPE